MYPEIHVTAHLSLPSYLMVISLTYCLALIWLVKRTDQFDMDQNVALDIALAIMIGGLVGARLFHVFYEAPQFYWEHPLEILKIWKGGFVFYGGAFMAFIGGVGVVKWNKEKVGPWADLFAPIGAFGYGLGRLACLLNGCCYGKYCDLPWNIGGRHPTPLYALLMESIILALLLWAERKRQQPHSLFRASGQIFFLWIGLHGLARILMEILRDDDRGPLLFSWSISTWMSLLLILVSSVGLFIHRPTSRS